MAKVRCYWKKLNFGVSCVLVGSLRIASPTAHEAAEPMQDRGAGSAAHLQADCSSARQSQVCVTIVQNVKGDGAAAGGKADDNGYRSRH